MTILEILKKNTFAIIMVLFVLMYVSYSEISKDANIDVNLEKTFAKITSEPKGRARLTGYKYLVNNTWYNVADKGGHRNKVKLNQYYRVEYNRDEPDVSRLLFNEGPIHPLELLNNPITVDGKVTRVGIPSKIYIDLYYSYTFKGENYDGRTRIHKDSLPCSTIQLCEKSKVEIKISRYFPDINDLHYRSYDRQSLVRKLNERYK